MLPNRKQNQIDSWARTVDLHSWIVRIHDSHPTTTNRELAALGGAFWKGVTKQSSLAATRRVPAVLSPIPATRLRTRAQAKSHQAAALVSFGCSLQHPELRASFTHLVPFSCFHSVPPSAQLFSLLALTTLPTRSSARCSCETGHAFCLCLKDHDARWSCGLGEVALLVVAVTELTRRIFMLRSADYICSLIFLLRGPDEHSITLFGARAMLSSSLSTNSNTEYEL